MKKNIITITGAGRQAYEKPSTKVYLMDMQHPMLAVSGEEKRMDIYDDEEEEWPVNPDTNEPFSPW